MPRERSPNSMLAESMYRDGQKLVEIADALGVPASTVRRWKATQKWDVPESERSDKKTSAKKSSVKKVQKTSARKKKTTKKTELPKKPRGAPKGSKNALGNKSSLPGNQKAVKHGAYRSVFFKFLSTEDQELLESMGDQIDVEERLLMELQVLSLRERRVLAAIEQQMKEAEDKGPLYVDSIETQRETRTFAKDAEGDKEKEKYKEIKDQLIEAGLALPGEKTTMCTRTDSRLNLIARLDRELTSIQKHIAQDLAQLEELQRAREEDAHKRKRRQLELELLDARIEQVDAQTNKLLGSNEELEDTSAIDAEIYGDGGGEADADAAQDAPMPADTEGSEAEADD